MIENYIKSECSEAWLEHGVIYQIIDKSISEITLPIAKQLIFDRRYASGDQTCPVLVIVNNAVNVNSETKKYYREEEPYIGILAIAMVLDNWVAKTIGSLVFKLQKQIVPTEFFSNEEKALEWLKKYK